MMVNLDNQRPGDLWKVDGVVYEVVGVEEPGVLECRSTQGPAFILVRTMFLDEVNTG